MKALSIQQPWAWLIVNGYKAVENRSWDTRYRGEFLIHAGKKIDHEAYGFSEHLNVAVPRDLPTGGIVGKARLINTVHVSQRHLLTERDKPWFFGEYGFILDSAEPCELRPCKGALGFFVPDFNSRYVVKNITKPKEKALKCREKSKDLPLFASRSTPAC